MATPVSQQTTTQPLRYVAYAALAAGIVFAFAALLVPILSDHGRFMAGGGDVSISLATPLRFLLWTLAGAATVVSFVLLYGSRDPELR